MGLELLRSLPYTIDEVKARAASSGRTLRHRTPEFYVWKIRLGVEDGIARPADVGAVELPANFIATVRVVWDGFVLLLGCKWLYEPDEPTVFTREFASCWCGVSVDQARGAITTLKRTGHMIPVGKHGSMTTWLPRRRT